MITIKTPQTLKNSLLLSPLISDYLKSLCLTSLSPVWLDKQSNTDTINLTNPNKIN